MSYTNSDLVEVRQKGDHKGLFARRRIARNTLLGCFDGTAHLVDMDTLRDDGAAGTLFWQQSIHLERLGNAILCLIPEGELGGVDFLNHNCRANADVIEKLRVYSNRDIEEGEEIVADYRSFDLVPRGIRCWCDVPDPCVF